MQYISHHNAKMLCYAYENNIIMLYNMKYNIGIAPLILNIIAQQLYLNVYFKNFDEFLDMMNVGEILLEYIKYFIEMGGITDFNFDGNITLSSDMEFLNSVLKINIMESNYLYSVKKALKEKIIELFTETGHDIMVRSYAKKIKGGNPITTQLINKIKESGKITELEILELKYNEDYEGRRNTNVDCQICSIVAPIGIHCNNDINTLITKTISISKLTHNNTIGILSGITSAFFISHAINNVPIEQWIEDLLNLLDSNTIKNHFELTDTSIMMDYVNFIRYWKNYYEERFTEGNKIIRTKSSTNLTFRMRNYTKYVHNFGNGTITGEDAISCLIISYDTLLESDGNFEKIIYYGLLMVGNMINVGTYVGLLFDIVYGDDNVPKTMIDKFQKK